MERGDQAGDEPASENGARPEPDPADRRFAAIVGALRDEDPRFARRVAEAHRVRSGGIMVLAGLVATLVLGVVPLAVGLQYGIMALLAVGAVGIALLPVFVPAVVGLVLARLRPAW